MSWTIVKKELTEYRRDERVLALAVLIVGLGVAAAVHGRSAVDAMERERVAAERIDRDVWNDQGEKNPHTAAHFSRYAFRPVSPLAVFDPGLTAYVGRVVWLEAHHRDPAGLRPIDDAVEIQRFAGLSPAWILQCLIPLLIVLLAFSSIAGERERGTLRYLMSSGVKPIAVFSGKSLAIFLLLLTFLPVVLVGVFFAGADGQIPDSPWRIAVLVIAYAVYLAGFTFAAIGASARLRRAKTALVVLLGFWVLSTVVVPRFSADLSDVLFPAPEGSDFWAQLTAESGSAFWSKEAKPVRDKIRDDLLQEHGVTKVEDLPINFDGYLLQASEEFANEVFDRRYGELAALYDKQSAFARMFTLFSPTIAVARLSSAMSGTDRYAHQHFTDAAETFRRGFIKMLNQDMIDNAGAEGYAYLADDALWKKTPDFAYAAPRIEQVWTHVWMDAAVLCGWALLGLAIALSGVRFSFSQEAQA